LPSDYSSLSTVSGPSSSTSVGPLVIFSHRSTRSPLIQYFFLWYIKLTNAIYCRVYIIDLIKFYFINSWTSSLIQNM
jgi:hypothetical protein